MLLITGTELLMGGAQVGVETSTLPLPSLQRQSPQSTCFTQLAVGGSVASHWSACGLPKSK